MPLHDILWWVWFTSAITLLIILCSPILTERSLSQSTDTGARSLHQIQGTRTCTSWLSRHTITMTHACTCTCTHIQIHTYIVIHTHQPPPPPHTHTPHALLSGPPSYNLLQFFLLPSTWSSLHLPVCHTLLLRSRCYLCSLVMRFVQLALSEASKITGILVSIKCARTAQVHTANYHCYVVISMSLCLFQCCGEVEGLYWFLYIIL